MSIKILLVDDHPMVRIAMRQAIMQRAGLEVVGETSTGAAALELATKLAPDLSVIDIHLPDMNGLEVMRRMMDLLPGTKTIIFTGDADRSQVDHALEAGASGFVWKRSAPEELMRGMDVVLAGGLYLSPEVNTSILVDYRKWLLGKMVPVKPTLSNCDKKLLECVAQGRRNKEIASQLAMSPKSIEGRRSRLMKKLGCSSSAELVRYAVREGIVSA